MKPSALKTHTHITVNHSRCGHAQLTLSKCFLIIGPNELSLLELGFLQDRAVASRLVDECRVCVRDAGQLSDLRYFSERSCRQFSCLLLVFEHVEVFSVAHVDHHGVEERLAHCFRHFGDARDLLGRQD